jgi:hypothetical protein
LHNNSHKRGFESASILLVKTGRKEVIGVYTSAAWQLVEKYEGNGECFVFRAHPDPGCWHWAGGNDMIFSSVVSGGLSNV